MEKDFLEEIIVGRSARNPRFRAMVEDALESRRALREKLPQTREKTGATQTQVAALMGTSQSAVARLEAGETDPKLSTLVRYASALGYELHWELAPGHDANAR